MLHQVKINYYLLSKLYWCIVMEFMLIISVSKPQLIFNIGLRCGISRIFYRLTRIWYYNDIFMSALKSPYKRGTIWPWLEISTYKSQGFKYTECVTDCGPHTCTCYTRTRSHVFPGALAYSHQARALIFRHFWRILESILSQQALKNLRIDIICYKGHDLWHTR